GSLETLASDPAVLRMMRHTFQREDAAKLSDVVEAAAQGDAQAQEALARSGEYLGVGLAAVVNMLCPNLLIISGEGVAAGDYRLQPMLRALRRYTFNGLLDDVDVIIEPTDDRTWARGAASLVMSKVFESPRVEVQANK
ncbi:MAG: ROK family protein, partial [Anaerolineae bacterium]|nr:ROK family protein [Anaerolineae bacterium]